jgi:hypothetical protein
VRKALVVAVACLASPAFADRTTTVNLGGMFGGVEDLDNVDNYYEQPTMHAAGGPRVVLGFENAPIVMPPTPGYNVGVAFVPELTAGAVLGSDRGDLFIGVGARGELQMAQREKGLFKVSARMAFYLAARALVIGKEQDTAGEFVLGEYFYVGRGRTRIGGEISVFAREVTGVPELSSFDETQMAVFASAYVGWAM